MQHFNLGENIKYYRKKNILTQVELARRTNLSRSKIAAYELGHSEPNINNIKRIADCLKVTIDELIFHDFDLSHGNAITDKVNSLRSIQEEQERISRIAEAYKELLEIKKINGSDVTSPLIDDLNDLISELTE